MTNMNNKAFITCPKCGGKIPEIKEDLKGKEMIIVSCNDCGGKFSIGVTHLEFEEITNK